MRLALIFSVVAGPFTMLTIELPALAEMLGLGYDPVRSPPAGPVIPGTRIVIFVADVSRPCASTVIIGIVVSDP